VAGVPVFYALLQSLDLEISLHHFSCYDETMKGGLVMKDKEGTITRVETACVQDNKVLALSVKRQDIDRCTKVIRQYGLLTPPVVGSFADGTRLLLSGECEFLALREIGIKSVDAVTVPITEENEGDKLSLLLSSLRKSPNALSEGLLITQMLKTGGFTQSQLGELLGKSVSWVNKRISLVTRLHPAVRDLVTQRQLCPHSAQEIARLPEEVQHAFSVKAVREGLPKSSVEVLVAAFNAPNCPDAIKEQIVENPRQTMLRLADIRTAKPIRTKPAVKSFAPASGLKESLTVLRQYMADFAKHLYNITTEDMNSEKKHLKELREDAAALLLMLDDRLKKLSFSPGKTAREVGVYGN
jgi:ParB family chromosome partitioning protein